MSEMLSEHFSLDEFIFSQTAVRQGIDNTPPPDVLRNLKHLAQQLEVVRAALGVPMLISSGYRCDALNQAVGGARNSDHKTGLAVDFTAPKFGDVLTTAKAVAKCGVKFDQVIYEYGRWVHLSVPAPDEQHARMQELSIMAAGRYTPGLGTA